MEEALALIRDRLAKAEVKASRAEKAWESARNEVGDFQTALRVMTELGSEASAPVTTIASATVVDRQLVILRLLQVGEESAASPAEIYHRFQISEGDDVNIDTFRTTIWRMKGVSFRDGWDLWLVKGDNGKYWKEPGTLATRQRLEAAAQVSTHPLVVDDEIDDDVPF